MVNTLKSAISKHIQFGEHNSVTVLDNATLNSIMPAGKLIQLGLGDVIEAPSNSEIYVLANGRIRLLKSTNGGAAKTSLVLSQRGQTFGALALFGTEITETARASDDTTVIQFDRQILIKAAELNPEFQRRLRHWESLRLALNSLEVLPEWNSADPKLVFQLLQSGEMLTLEKNARIEVSAPQANSSVLLCCGQCDLEVNAEKSTLVLGELKELPNSLTAAPTLTAISECIIFVGSTSDAKKLQELPKDDAKIPNNTKGVDLLASGEVAVPYQTANSEEKQKSSTTPASKNAQESNDYQPNAIYWVRKKFRQYPLIVQMSAMDCGVACLAMIAAYYGRSVRMSRLRDLAKVTNQGTDLKSLVDAAETIGFLARGIKANYEGLLRLKLPIICHWGTNHYTVLYEITRDDVTMADPADDLIRLTKEKFLERYSGYALELSPTAKLGDGEKRLPSFGRYWPLLKAHQRTLLDIGLASIVIQLLMLATPLFTQVVVDKVLIHQSLSMLNVLLLGMILLSLFQTVVTGLRTYFMAFTGMKLDQSLFVHFYKHVLSLPLSFFEERTQGDVMTRFAENRKIRELMSGSTLATLIDVFMAIAYLLIIYIYNFAFGLFTTAYVLIFALIAFAVAPTLRTIRRRAFHKDIAANSYLLESLRGIEKIKSAASENRTRWAWELRFVDALNTNFTGTLVSRATQLVSELVHLSGNILLLWFGANLVIQETISIGQLMAMNLMVARITEPILHVVDVWDDLQDVTVALERLDDVLDQKSEESDLDSKFFLPSVTGKIRFDSVTFRYPGNSSQNALQNVSFVIEPGQMIGVVGRSGCGKSTLLKLIQGLYPPTGGRIYVDDHDLANVSLSSLRTNIGVVAQHDYLFRGSIHEAIAYYKPDASIQEVISAAKLAGIHEFISSLPRAYDYELTEAGGNLSGGQRQRMAIARAIVHNPKIIIFDEATSFLDSESERAIQSSLVLLRGNRTMIVVAHRLSTIRDCDTIFVVDRGQIVETGNHATLLQKKGLYYFLCQQQTIE